MSDLEQADQLAAWAMRDVRDVSYEMALFEAYLHRRKMAWFIRRKEGVAGAVDAHEAWLAVDRDFRAFREAALARVCRIAEQFDDAAAALVCDTDWTSGDHGVPPKSAA